METELLLALCLLVGAALYTSVGHAGASAYIAIMALFGLAPEVMRPTALVLNIIAASLGTFRYTRAGLFRWRTLWPFLIGSIPFAFIGGAIRLPGDWYRVLVGAVLLISAARLLWPRPLKAMTEWRDPPLAAGVLGGALIGLLAGLTGTGGGIFLSPVLIFLAWSDPKRTVGVASLFILCNSIAGLSGNLAAVQALPADLPLFVGAVVIGALIGTTLGIRSATPVILKLLGAVLVVAGVKLIGVY